KAVSFLSGSSPLQNEDDLSFWIEGQPKPSSQSEMNMALIYVVEPGYLKAMGLPLRRGRFFTPQDDERSVPGAVIDETLAHKYFGTSDPVGRRLILNGQTDPVSIVGVVSHVKQWGLDNDASESLQAQLYLPFRALPDDAVAGVATG